MDAPTATVIVAGLSAVVGPTMLTLMAGRRVRRKVDAVIGRPNGDGNVVEMLDRCLLNQSDMALQISRHHESRAVSDQVRFNELQEIRRTLAEMQAVETERWRSHDLDSAAYRAGQASVHAALLGQHLTEHHASHPAIELSTTTTPGVNQ